MTRKEAAIEQAVNTVCAPSLVLFLARLFGKRRIVDGQTVARWRGREYLI